MVRGPAVFIRAQAAVCMKVQAAAQKRNRILRLRRLVARVKASKAQRCFIEVLDATKVFLVPITKVRREFANVGLGHWRCLVAPLE